MIIELKDSNSKIMPWKNGGGTTMELYRLNSPEEDNDFIFRVSKATVSSSGPFSLFPNIDRILFLMEGDGFELKFTDKCIKLDKKKSPIYFQGEDEIHCRLIHSTCTDFNIMTDRRYGRASIEFSSMSLNEAKNIQSEDTIFLYQINHHLLIIRYQSFNK